MLLPTTGRHATLCTAPFVCPVCGLLYLRGDKPEESAHRRFHRRFLDGPPVTARRLTTLDEGGRTVIYADEASNRQSQAIVASAIARASRDLGDAPPLPPRWECYLVQQGAAVAGFALVQRGVRAYLAGRREHRALCPVGVLRLWVHAAHRRRGIATAAVDAARHHGGAAVPRCMVAFSEPTDAGLAFARAYAATDPFVFDIEWQQAVQ
jgi:N-acetyltransferase